MPPHRETAGPLKARLWAGLFTGLSLGVFLILLACVLASAWLYERGV